jgi:hypothetical protein
MKFAISLLVLSNLILAPVATAREAEVVDVGFCSQFLIHNPDPRLLFNSARDYMHDWDARATPLNLAGHLGATVRAEPRHPPNRTRPRGPPPGHAAELAVSRQNGTLDRGVYPGGWVRGQRTTGRKT